MKPQDIEHSRRDHTLIGRPVNLAAHLSERATPGTVWISQNTYDRLVDKNGFVLRSMPVVQKEQEPTAVYEMACCGKVMDGALVVQEARIVRKHPVNMRNVNGER